MSKNTETRRNEIYSLLVSSGKVKVKELAQYFHVTMETIRKDLNIMEDRGLLIKKHGGAEVLNEFYKLPLDIKITEHSLEKQKIAKAALPFIKDNSIIFLDPGSTTLYLAKYLRLKKGLTIVTNSLAIAQIVSETNHELLFAGGKLQKQGKSFVGPFTTAIIDSIVIDTAFMSCDGFMDGPTTFSHEEMEVKKHVINRSTQKILLSDSSKFSKHSTYTFAKCSDYDYLICDDIKNQDKKRIEGIKSIIIAET